MYRTAILILLNNRLCFYNHTQSGRFDFYPQDSMYNQQYCELKKVKTILFLTSLVSELV